MRAIAVMLSYPPLRWIGAELATHAFLKALQVQAWDVRVLSSSAVQRYTWDGIQVDPLLSVDGGSALALALHSNVVITHPYRSPDLVEPVRQAQRTGSKVVVLAHNGREHSRAAVAEAWPDMVCANSWATARALGSPLEHVIRPPLRLPGWGADRAGKHNRTAVSAAVSAAAGQPRPYAAGYVNSAVMKGGLALRDLRQGRYKILGVAGGYGEQMVPGDPVIAVHRMSADYYRKVRIHLQPSLEESWGMAGLEALAEGCFLVATDLPGVQEAVRGVPSYWIRWLPRTSEVTFRVLEAVIRGLLAERPPTAEDVKGLTRALWRTALAGDADRVRISGDLRRMVERSRIFV
jgi:hypothetical protein